MTKTLYSLGIEFALFLFKIKLMLADLIKHKFKMALMLLNAITEHKDIIEICMHENADVFLKDMVHEPLKS
jgi:hypothetical protein